MHTISGLTIIDAVGTSLIPVSTFGFLTAIRYSFSRDQLVHIIAFYRRPHTWGFFYGTRKLAKISKERLQKVFAIILIVVAVYIILRSLSNIRDQISY